MQVAGARAGHVVSVHLPDPVFFVFSAALGKMIGGSFLSGGGWNPRYLSGGQCVEIPGVPDARDFQELKEALTCLKFSVEDQANVMQLLAVRLFFFFLFADRRHCCFPQAVLHLGNMVFKEYNEKAFIADGPGKLKHLILLRLSNFCGAIISLFEGVRVFGESVSFPPLLLDVRVWYMCVFYCVSMCVLSGVVQNR